MDASTIQISLLAAQRTAKTFAGTFSFKCLTAMIADIFESPFRGQARIGIRGPHHWWRHSGCSFL